jgi:hypothetical protein
MKSFPRRDAADAGDLREQLAAITAPARHVLGRKMAGPWHQAGNTTMAVNKTHASPQSIIVVLDALVQRYIELAHRYIEIAEQVANGELSTSEARKAGRALDRVLSTVRNVVKAAQLN